MAEKKKFIVNDEEKRAKCISFKIIYQAYVNTIKESF
jgi:hypothetical protein